MIHLELDVTIKERNGMNNIHHDPPNKPLVHIKVDGVDSLREFTPEQAGIYNLGKDHLIGGCYKWKIVPHLNDNERCLEDFYGLLFIVTGGEER